VARTLDRTLEAVRALILDGHFREGERLREMELAGRLGVGRGTLRTALLRLVDEGLVHQRDYRDTHVVRITTESAKGIEQLRGTLDGLACRLAASQVTAEQGRRLRSKVEHLETAAGRDLRLFEKVDWEFHHQVVEIAANDLLHKHYQLMAPIATLASRRNPPASGDLLKMVEDHRRVLRAILSGDLDLAEQVGSLHGHARTEA
jgi:DNA-binding GntR family transcriptional regulator